MNNPTLEQELKELAAESIGWLPLEDGAYLHISSDGKDDRVIITGLAIPARLLGIASQASTWQLPQPSPMV